MWFPSPGKIIFLFIIITIILSYFENYSAVSALILVLSVWTVVSALDVRVGKQHIGSNEEFMSAVLNYLACATNPSDLEIFSNSSFVLLFSVFLSF